MTVQYQQTSSAPSRAIIALHGWTGNADSMQSVAGGFGFSDTLWIFPQAPYSASPGGFSWYDGDKISGWKHTASFSLLDKLVQEQFENGFAANDLFLLGFSQGASLVMEYMIRQRFSMAGVIAIAGFIHDKKRFVRETTPESKNSRVLLIHGEKDQVIYPSASEKAHKLLHESGYQSELQILQSSHKVPLKAKSLIESFINFAAVPRSN